MEPRSTLVGRLDHGYRRRDPNTAAAYFASVGLTGPFWGTEFSEHLAVRS